ncbi:hypothetical protein M9434_005077 [Picochlorum sp. BPE23]|nr:hypothetical protein M9434_005077 [Picochlorum sp. BPE23]
MVDTDTAREIDSLRCDVSVQGTLLNYANKVVETEKKKVAVVAHDSKIVLNSLLEDIQETKRRGAREEAWLKFLVSKYEVAQHGMERDKMHDNIKYNAAVDSLSQQKELIGQLMRYMAADREVGRCIAGQNAVLLKELHRMMDVARSTCGRLSKSRHMVESLKKELGMKDDMLHQLQNQMMLTRTQYDERMHLLDSDLRRAQSRANEPHSDTTFLDTMMKECGVSSKDEVVKRVKGYEGLEKEVARLKKACQEQEKKRKEAEKAVKEQKKDITAKSKRITSLEESLKAQTQMTPSAPKAVTHAMQAVGNLVDQLGASPMSGASKSFADTESIGSRNKRRRKRRISNSVTKKDGDDDVSHWNPDSSAAPSDKENAPQILRDPSKALSFATRPNDNTTTEKNKITKKGVVASSGVSAAAAPQPKRRLLSVTTHHQNKNNTGALPRLKPGSGFSIPKLSQK